MPDTPKSDNQFPQFNLEGLKPYRTDINFTLRFFANPLCWIHFEGYWSGRYGLRLGPILICIDVINYFDVRDQCGKKP